MSVNKAILIGNIGKDLELKHIMSGDAICTFSLATTEKYTTKAGEKKEATEWHNIVVWRQLAEICGEYLSKGSHVYIEGKIQNRSYDDRDGNKKYITEIVADQMQMLGQRGVGQQNADQRSADPVGFLDTIATELKDIRAENVKLKGAVSIKQDRVNDLEKALRDTLRQLEKAINGNAMDGDWIVAELHGRECLYA